MSYIPYQNRVDARLSSQGDGTGVTDMGVAGKSITGATTASPTVITATSHGYVVGDWIFIDGATGTTEINGLRQVNTVPNANTLTVKNEAGVVQGSAGTFGGTVDSNIALVYKPTSTESVHLARLNAAASDATVVADGMMGVARLTNGLHVAVYDGTLATLTDIAVIYGWNDWALYAGGGDVPITWADAAVIEGMVKWTFHRIVEGTRNTSSVKLRGSSGDFIVAYTQDDIDGLVALRMMVQGYK